MKMKMLTLDEFLEIKGGMLTELENKYDDDAPVDEDILVDKINSMIEEAFFNTDLMSDILGEFDRNRKSGDLADATLEPLGMLLDRLLIIINRIRLPIYTVCEIRFINATGDFIIRLK